MLNHLLDRTVRRRGTCRNGHVWTEMARPVACSQCGRTRPDGAVR